MELHDSVYNADLTRVQTILAHYRGNERVKSLALVLAASLGHREIVCAFIKAETRINTSEVLFNFQRKWETRPIKKLHYDWQVIMAPFLYGWSPRITPLCAAAFWGHGDIVKVLVNAGASLDTDPYFDDIGFAETPTWNALTCALVGGHETIAEYLMLMGAHATDMPEAVKPMAALVLRLHTVVLPLELIDIVLSYVGEKE